MDIYPDTINIPKIEYNAHVTLPSAEFSCIVSDHSQLGDRIWIEVHEEGVRFIRRGRAVSGNIFFARPMDPTSPARRSSRKQGTKEVNLAREADKKRKR